MLRIEPIPGSTLWYIQRSSNPSIPADPDKPLAAVLARENANGTVNLAIFDAIGRTHAVTEVRLQQPDDAEPSGDYACWPEPIVQGARQRQASYEQWQRIMSESKASAEVAAAQGGTATGVIGQPAADTLAGIDSANVAQQTAAMETKVYTDGTAATGVPPLPDQSPAQQDAADAQQAAVPPETAQP